MQQGYGVFGRSAHTNTVTDPLGNLTLRGVRAHRRSGRPPQPLHRNGSGLCGHAGRLQYLQNLLYSGRRQADKRVVLRRLNNLGQRLRPWQSNYNPFGNLIASIDPLLHTWSYVSFDAAGLDLISAQDPTGESVHIQYGENNNPAALPTSIQDAAGITRLLWNYNLFGQPTTQTVPAGASGSGTTETTTLSYDPLTGDLIEITDPQGDQSTINSYDPLGDPLSMSFYPDTGNPATSHAPLTSTVTWDAAQQLALAGLPNGVHIQGFRTNGILTDVQVRAPAPAGGNLLSQLHYDYDSRGRVYNTSDLIGTVAQYRFDKASEFNLYSRWGGPLHAVPVWAQR